MFMLWWWRWIEQVAHHRVGDISVELPQPQTDPSDTRIRMRRAEPGGIKFFWLGGCQAGVDLPLTESLDFAFQILNFVERALPRAAGGEQVRVRFERVHRAHSGNGFDVCKRER